MGGFLSGITSGFDKIKTFVGGIASWIGSHKGPISYDRQLLIPHGNAMMAGLNEGLTDWVREGAGQRRQHGWPAVYRLAGLRIVVGSLGCCCWKRALPWPQRGRNVG